MGQASKHAPIMYLSMTCCNSILPPVISACEYRCAVRAAMMTHQVHDTVQRPPAAWVHATVAGMYSEHCCAAMLLISTQPSGIQLQMPPPAVTDYVKRLGRLCTPWPSPHTTLLIQSILCILSHLVINARVVNVLALWAEDLDRAGAWQVTGAHRQARLTITQHPAGREGEGEGANGDRRETHCLMGLYTASTTTLASPGAGKQQAH